MKPQITTKKLALEEKKPKSWCKSISAFANCFGGKLIFGVSNDNDLVWLVDAEGDAEKISEEKVIDFTRYIDTNRSSNH